MAVNTLSEIASLWNRVLTKLETEINDSRVFDVFFKNTYIYSINGKEIVIACESSLVTTILHDRYEDLVVQTINELTGSDFEVAFINGQNIKNSNIEEMIQESKPKFLQNCEISPNFTFDNFVVGVSNKEASQASLIVASNIGKLYNPLFIYSQSGLGKTHLLNAIGNYVKEINPSQKVLYCSSQTFFDEYQNSIKNQKTAEAFKAYLKQFNLLLIDDIQFFQNKKSTEEFFFNIFEHMKANNKQIVLTSDRSPSELHDLDSRLQTRFSSGLQISIQKPTTEMCVDILKKKIAATGLTNTTFDDDVIYLLADKFKNSIRELEGALNRLLFYSSMNHVDKIDIDIAVSALQPLIDLGDSREKVSAQKILNVVSSYYNLSVSQITGKMKTGQIVIARHIAIYLIRNMLDLSLKQIGELFSNRDHSTIIHSIDYVDDLLKKDPHAKTVVEELKKKID